MKKIEAVIRPEKLAEVKAVLEKAGSPGIMITEIEGHGKQKGYTQSWRGEEYRVDLVPKVKIDIVVNDEDVERLIKVITDCARTEQVGDGKIFVSDVLQVVRIRTGEKGKTAI